MLPGVEAVRVVRRCILVGATEGFFHPAYSAMVPALLPADDPLAANGVEGMLRPLAQQTLDPAPAGLLVSAFASGVALLLAAAVRALAAVAIGAMRRVPVAPAEVRTSLVHDLPEEMGPPARPHPRRSGFGAAGPAMLT